MTEPYVTVHDFVTAVHPWLVELRGDILAAMKVWEGSDEPMGTPLPNDTDLLVNLCLELPVLDEGQKIVGLDRQQHGSSLLELEFQFDAARDNHGQTRPDLASTEAFGTFSFLEDSEEPARDHTRLTRDLMAP
ncbi:hypothetical protein DL98DRAFT_605839 [Cadophora sp. DSE1049]|nr:hypothetical protein DL98DRAFT_605839 [Cadophora sp. DSE1049]